MAQPRHVRSISAQRISIAAAVALASLVATSSAQAGTYCVADQDCVAAGGAASPTIQAALSAAQTTKAADTVRIGPGTFIGNFNSGPVSSPLTIVGAGRGKTIIGAAAGNGFPKGLTIEGSSTVPASVRDLTITIAGTSMRGLELVGGASALRVDINGTNATDSKGVSADPGTYEGGTITMPGKNDVGVSLLSSGSIVRDASITASVGVDSESATPTANLIQRTAITTSAIGVWLSRGPLRVEDALLDGRTAANSRMLQLYNGNGGASGHLVARNVTVVGNPAGMGTGVTVYTNGAPYHFTATVQDSVFTGFKGTTSRSASAGSADVEFDHVVHGPAAYDANDGTGTGAITETSPLGNPADLGFVDAAGGDFRLTAASPLVDAGSPGPLAGDDGPLDLAGLPRLADGNKDGQPVRDIGAYELAGPAMVDDAPPIDPAAASDGASGANAGNTGMAEPTPTATPATSGPSAAPTPGNALPLSDHTAPTLTKLAISQTTKRAATKKKPTIAFQLDEAATVTVTLVRRAGKRWIPVKGALVVHGHPGANTAELTTAVGGRRLAAGSYRVIAVARDVAGNVGRSITITAALRAS